MLGCGSIPPTKGDGIISYSKPKTRSIERASASPEGHAAFDCDETALYPSRPIVQRAKGLYLWLQGEELPYIDLIQGYSVTIFGHCDDGVTECAAGVLKTIDHVAGMTSPAREELANLVAQLTPVKRGRVYFDVGGAQIVSIAVRLAGRVTQRARLLALSNAFHGYSAEGEILSKAFIEGVASESASCAEIDFVDVGSTEVFGLLRSREYAAFLIEPIQGANGLVALPNEWMVEAYHAARDSETLIISDEVQVGVGRTGTFAAVERYEIVPDIVVYGKALCAGVFPLSALVVSEAVYQKIPSYPASALGSTFSTSPFGCGVGAYVVHRVKDLIDDGRIEALGQMISERLDKLIGQAGITVVRHYGLGLALDFNDSAACRRFVSSALENRLFLYSCGRQKNVIKLYPPFTITNEEAALICSTLEEVVAGIERKRNSNLARPDD